MAPKNRHKHNSAIMEGRDAAMVSELSLAAVHGDDPEEEFPRWRSEFRSGSGFKSVHKSDLRWSFSLWDPGDDDGQYARFSHQISNLGSQCEVGIDLERQTYIDDFRESIDRLFDSLEATVNHHHKESVDLLHNLCSGNHTTTRGERMINDDYAPSSSSSRTPDVRQNLQVSIPYPTPVNSRSSRKGGGHNNFVSTVSIDSHSPKEEVKGLLGNYDDLSDDYQSYEDEDDLCYNDVEDIGIMEGIRRKSEKKEDEPNFVILYELYATLDEADADKMIAGEERDRNIDEVDVSASIVKEMSWMGLETLFGNGVVNVGLRTIWPEKENSGEDNKKLQKVLNVGEKIKKLVFLDEKPENNMHAFDPGGFEMGNDKEAKEQIGVISVDEKLVLKNKFSFDLDGVEFDAILNDAVNDTPAKMVADDKYCMKWVLAGGVKFRILWCNSKAVHRKEGNMMSDAMEQLCIVDGAHILITGKWPIEARSEAKIVEIMSALCSTMVIFGACEKSIRHSTVAENVMIFDPGGHEHVISQRKCTSEYALLASELPDTLSALYNKLLPCLQYCHLFQLGRRVLDLEDKVNVKGGVLMQSNFESAIGTGGVVFD